MPEWLREFVESPVARWVVAVGAAFLGLAVAAVAGTLAGRVAARRHDRHVASIAAKAVFYLLLVLAVVLALSILPIDLTGMVATAGILGFAIGFAAQTSFSNIISGLFLIFEGSFRVGDLIQTSDLIGTVLSIDLLSVKVRSLDNRFVRIPNESLIKGNLTNLTRYDIRRLDLKISVGYGAPLRKAVEILDRLVNEHLYVLKKPDPTVSVEGLGDSGIDLVVRVWVDRAEFLQARSEVLISIKEALDAAKIEIPFPQRTLSVDTALLDALRKGKERG
jgi:small-conductance mechanosensitive channel